MENRRIQLLPFWLAQMDVDIRKPPSNFRIQRPNSMHGEVTTPAIESNNNDDDSKIEIKIDDTSKNSEKYVEPTEGTPLLAHQNSNDRFFDESSYQNGGTPSIQPPNQDS